MSDTEKFAVFLQGLIEGRQIVTRKPPTRWERLKGAARYYITMGAALLCSLS